MRPIKRTLCALLTWMLLFNCTVSCAYAQEVPEAETETVQETIPETTEPEIAETVPADTNPAEEEPAETETAEAEMPLFFQTDYPDTRFGRGTVSSSGCSITSLAMVASYLTGHTYYPDELAGYFGGYGENNMQRLEYASDMLQLPWEKAENVHAVFSAVKEGKVAILLMNSGSLFSNSQHFIVVKGMTEDGKYLVNDPYAPNYDLWNLREGFKTGFRDGELICGYSGGWVYDVDAMPENPFIYVEEKVEVEPRYPEIQLTPEEYELLAKVIWVEARGECADGQQAIAEIVFNRMKSEKFPDTLMGVLYAEGQFRSLEFIDEAEPWQAQYDAIDDALAGPYVLPETVVHFATYPVNEFVWGEIGGHVFCHQWGTGTETEE